VKVLNIKALYDFDGYVVDKISCQKMGAQVNLEFDGRCGPRCHNCSTRLTKHRCKRQTAADLPIASGLIVYINFPVVQGLCRKCQHFVTTRPQEIHPTKDATWRLMRRVSQMTRYSPVTAVAEMMGLGESTVRRYDMAVLKEDLPEPNLDGLRVIIIDEKSIRRGHGYVTLVLNGETGELLHMAEGKKKASLESFFEKLTEEQKGSIEAACIDRAGSYQSALGEQIPKAAVVYDHFHLRLNLNTAVDEVRRQEWRKASDEDKSFIKGHRFILLATEENLDEKGSGKLAALQEINENIATAHYLKEQFRVVHTYRYAGSARKALEQWCDMAEESELVPFQRLANSFRKGADKIVAFCKHRITSGKIEGFNNLVSRVVHRACGITNLAYAWLKFRQLSIQPI
jgi:transposase